MITFNNSVVVLEYILTEEERSMKKASCAKVASLMEYNKNELRTERRIERYHERMKQAILADFNRHNTKQIGRFTITTV
jgi:hypothetical protein